MYSLFIRNIYKHHFIIIMKTSRSHRFMIAAPLFGMMLMLSLSFSSCSKGTSHDTPSADSTATSDSGSWEARYDSIAPDSLRDNVFDLIGNQWMLVTAGDTAKMNTMTAAWGGFGMLWSKPTAFITIKDIRYTYQFLQDKHAYTLSFFDEKYRPALNICGTKSGRDTDKIKEAGLTPITTPSGMMTFKEARMVIECVDMYETELDPNAIRPAYKDSIVKEYYTADKGKHHLFLSEIKHIWVKKGTQNP